MNNSTEKLKTIEATKDATEECCEPISGTKQKNNIELSISPLAMNPSKKEPRKRLRYFSEASEKNSQISEVSGTTSYNCINDNSVWFNYKLRTHAGEERIYEQYRVYNEHPEDHPSYAHEWETFWNIRYTNLSMEGEEPTYEQIKHEWIPFWIVRLKQFEMLEISDLRSSIWDHVRRETGSCSKESSTNESPDGKESSQNYTRRELTDKRNKYDERNLYRFRRITESPPKISYCYSSSKKHFEKDYHRERSPKQDYRRNSKEIVCDRSKSRKIRHDKEMSITVVSCCCEILGIAEVSESVRTQITALLVLALDYEKHGLHSKQSVMSKDNMEFFKLVRNKIKESLEAGHITSKRPCVVEDIINNISILIDNRRDKWMSGDKQDPVNQRRISPIRAPSDSSALKDPERMVKCSTFSPHSPTFSPHSPTYSPHSPIYGPSHPSSSTADSSVDKETLSSPIIVVTTEENEEPIDHPSTIVRSVSSNSLLSSDSATLPPGVSDYEVEVMDSKPLTLVSSDDSIVVVEESTPCEDIPSDSTAVEDNPGMTLNIDNQEHEYIKDLTDDELKYLLKNFKQLTDDEQQCLIIFLEKIDHSGDEDRMKELRNYMLNCEEDEEVKKTEIIDSNNNMIECYVPIEVVDDTKTTMNDISDVKDSPIIPSIENKQWKTFKVTLNVEDSLRKVDRVGDKDSMIDVEHQ